MIVVRAYTFCVASPMWQLFCAYGARCSSEFKTAVRKNRTANVASCVLCAVHQTCLVWMCFVQYRCAVKAAIDRINIFSSLYIILRVNLRFACFSTCRLSRVTSETINFCSQLIGFRSIRFFTRQYSANTIRLWIFKQSEGCVCGECRASEARMIRN